MNNILDFPNRSRIQEEASLWLVKLDSGELSNDDSQAFRQWLNTSMDHKNTLIELAGLWQNMDVLSELSDLFPLSKKPKIDIIESIYKLKFLLRPAVIASVSAILLVSLSLYLNPDSIQPNLTVASQVETVYRTAVGEQAEIILPDGSDTTLNTDSVVEVAYNKAQRNIRLVKGEAHFNVAHNDNRPFVVHAGTGVIRAIGTAFSVHIKGDVVEVIVTEGRVEIASAVEIAPGTYIDLNQITPGKFLTTIAAGQSVEYGNENIHSVQQIGPELISRKLSWQHGMLVFEGNPLDEVVEEISRYTNTEIIISDPDIRKIRVGGYFKTGETDALLTVLEDNFSIHVERVNGNLIYLSGPRINQAANEQ